MVEVVIACFSVPRANKHVGCYECNPTALAISELQCHSADDESLQACAVSILVGFLFDQRLQDAKQMRALKTHRVFNVFHGKTA